MARAMLFGLSISPGIAIGPVHLLHSQDISRKRRITGAEIGQEQEMLRFAASRVRATLEQTIQKVPHDLAEYREVIAAQMEMARDPKLLDASLARIEHKKISASWALSQTIEELCALFEEMDDPYLRDRSQDIRTVGLRMRDFLVDKGKKSDINAPYGILIAEDISPADIVEVNLSAVQGILTAQGGTTSHTAILARGQRIPALAGVNDLLSMAREGETAIINGLEGYALLGPDALELREHTEKQAHYASFAQETARFAHWPAETTDGVCIHVAANLENAREADGLEECGAEGIGLYRTEFAFLGDFLPSEEDLYQEYLRVVSSMKGKRIVFRTLDVGADKMMRMQHAYKESNPALGLRGIRFCLCHQSIFRMQLRAILRAAADGNVAVMLPLISSVHEVMATKRILQEIRRELSAAHIPHATRLPLGVMIETPAAALIADILASQCEFFSIGTNDLVHYLMAIDRNNRQVAYLHEPLHPAVLKAIKAIIDAAHREGIGVSICGELATDPAVLVLLLGLGADALSVAPLFVPGLKQTIRHLSLAACMELANNVLRSSDSMSSHRMVQEHLLQFLGPETFHNTCLPQQTQ